MRTRSALSLFRASPKLLLPMRRRDAFTLIEICLAVVIALLIVFVAVPSVSGLFREQKLKRTYEAFDDFVRQAQMRSVTERRTFLILWGEAGLTLEPEEPTEEDITAEVQQFAFTDDASFVIERPIALQKKAPQEWTFWRSGTCEPAIVSYKGDAGSWVVKYEPLTARGTFLEQTIK